MNKWTVGLCITAGFVLVFGGWATRANSQSTAPVSTIQWSRNLKPVVLGSGLQVTPGQISVVNQSLNLPLDSTGFSWQNKSVSLNLLDFSELSDTINQLNLNAWGEYSGLLSGGGFSVDFKQYQAFQGNHRHWEVDIRRNWAAFIPNPALNISADKVARFSSPTTFNNLFGNYAVTGIAYKRVITIKFDGEFEQSLSASQIDAAIQASYGSFSGGGSISAAQSNLSVFSRVTINIMVDGGGGAQLLATGATGDLPSLVAAVANQLAQWDTQPIDPNSAGTVDYVFVTPYTAISPYVKVQAQPGPNQVALANAIGEYVVLQQAVTRLGQIRQQDKNLNPLLQQYLFGITGKNGKHVPNTGKLDEATADLALQYTYLHTLGKGFQASDPNISFHFDDPDVVSWRILQSFKTDKNLQWYVDVEIYSNARVTSTVSLGHNGVGLSYTPTWQTNATQSELNNQWYYTFGPTVAEAISYTANLDPVTGIPHRYIEFRGPNEPNCPFNGDGNNSTWGAIISLQDASGNGFYNATDWNGLTSTDTPTPTIFIPGEDFIYDPTVPSGDR